MGKRPGRGLAHFVVVVFLERHDQRWCATPGFDVADCPRAHLADARVAVVAECRGKYVGRFAGLELTEGPRGVAADRWCGILLEHVDECRDGARRVHPPDGADGGFAYRRVVVAEQLNER